MANRVVDGFDWFPTGKTESQRNTLWGANGWFYDPSFVAGPVPDVSVGRFGYGLAMNIYNAGSGATSTYTGMVVPVDGLLTECYVAFGMYYPSSTGDSQGSGNLVSFFDGVNFEHQLTVYFRANGVVQAYIGNTGATTGHWPMATQIGSSPVGKFEEDRWMVVEIYGKVAHVGGELEVRINTVPVLQIVGADTCGGTVTDTFDSIWLAARGGGTRFILDDFYINDVTGSTNNTWMGNLRVFTSFVIADGFTNDFTIGGTVPAASNWQSVLNSALDDTKYVYSSTINDIDLYEIDPVVNSPAVRVLQVRMALKQDDATQRSAKALIRIGATTYEDDVEHFTNQDYTFYFGRWELNPSTGVSFTGTEVNGLEIGVKVES